MIGRCWFSIWFEKLHILLVHASMSANACLLGEESFPEIRGRRAQKKVEQPPTSPTLCHHHCCCRCYSFCRSLLPPLVVILKQTLLTIILSERVHCCCRCLCFCRRRLFGRRQHIVHRFPFHHGFFTQN